MRFSVKDVDSEINHFCSIFLKGISYKTKFIAPTDSNENGSNQQKANVYSNPSEYVPMVSPAEAFGDDDTPF
ncbi:hypothetical protein [Myroides sp. TSA_177.3]|uniref:hypothetical protein n=1 Tax=Myroides sp. TSA_177.3 TaxID=3415650 RepID=UPI0040456F4D